MSETMPGGNPKASEMVVEQVNTGTNIEVLNGGTDTTTPSVNAQIKAQIDNKISQRGGSTNIDDISYSRSDSSYFEGTGATRGSDNGGI